MCFHNMLHVFRTQIDQNDIFWTTKFQIKKLFFSSFIIFQIIQIVEG